MVYALMTANTAIYMLWLQAPSDYNMYRLMQKHFMMSSDGVLHHGKIHTIFTAMFSHQQFFHLFSNMFTLYFFGTEAAVILGKRMFLNIYLTGGVAGGIAYVMWPLLVDSIAEHTDYPSLRRHKLSHAPGLGASGAVSAVITWSICNYPTRIIYLYAVLPVPAAVFGIGFILMDAVEMYHGNVTGGPAHVGGALAGAAFFVCRKFIGRGRF